LRGGVSICGVAEVIEDRSKLVSSPGFWHQTRGSQRKTLLVKLLGYKMLDWSNVGPKVMHELRNDHGKHSH
jgi:hypothetical protein